jgi:SAM-dependent methyltransferase
MEMDAQKIPLENDSFDLILLFEAIYYLEHPQIFVKEANRLLRSHGCLIIATVNKDWADFHPSPYTHKYFSVPELTHLLDLTFKKVELYGAFSTQSASLFSKGSSLLKRTAVRLDLIPGSLAARAHLKRLFMGPLQPVPNQLYDGMASYDPPSPISTDKVNSDFKIIYAVATK